MNKPQHFLPAQNQLGETPIWSPDEKVLYWVDWGGRPTCRYDFSTEMLTTFPVDLPITAIARRRSGGWLAVSQHGIYDWNPATNVYQLLIGPADPDQLNICFNDCAVDREGRLLVGTVDMDDVFAPTGSLFQVDKDLTLRQLDTGYATANGIGISPDGKRIYVTDMRNHQIIALDYQSEDGKVDNRQCFAVVPEDDGMPDGLIVDSEGFVWSGHWAGWKLTRYDPSGQIERQIKFPVEHVISFAFGNEGLDQLFVTTAWWGYSDEERQQRPWAGDIFRVEPGVRGLVEPVFDG
jgi:sugar lactone lactonase YvrE